MANVFEHEPPADPWMEAMRRGDFAAAWKISDTVLRRRVLDAVDCSHWPRHLQFVWQGAPLRGRHVLVHCYHGLGDTLQFCRLLAVLRPQVAAITLCAQPALVKLLGTLRGVDHCRPLDEPEPDAEVAIELMELPHALRLGLRDIPCQIPYIYVSPQPVPHPGTALRIGLVWQSGDWNPARSLPSAALQTWSRIAGVSWNSLQYPPLPPPFPMRDLACESLDAMAARMRSLDLVITVDTMQAHLAGALGIPVWLLLHHRADWRWMRERNDSPWYPTMRLFRQRRPGHWSDAIEAVTRELEVRAATPMRDIRSAGCKAS